MLINSGTLNIYFIYHFCSRVLSGEAHLNFMSDWGVSSYAVLLQPASVSHIHIVEHSIYNPQQHITVPIPITQCPITVIHVVLERQAIPD